jgi:ankyrin repeat protein
MIDVRQRFHAHQQRRRQWFSNLRATTTTTKRTPLLLLVTLMTMIFSSIVLADDDALRARLPLIFSAAEGNVQGVLEALREDADACVHQITEHGETALHVAGIPGGAQLVRVLIEGGCDVNARTHGGQYLRMAPIHWMTYGATPKHREGLEALLEFGSSAIDVNAQNDEGKTAMDMAMVMGDHGAEILEVLARYGGKPALKEEGRDEL